MKKYLFILLSVLFLAACGQSLVHDDFKADLDQVLEKTDAAYDENRRLTDDEKDLLDRFSNKYLLGQFFPDDESYQMSDIEKEITRIVSSLDLWTEGPERLSSESTIYDDYREQIDELLEMSNVPEELIDKYPVYERQIEMVPEFEEDAKELIEKLVPFIDDAYYDESDVSAMRSFIDKYEGEGFEVDGTIYLHNDITSDVVLLVNLIQEDIKEGTLHGSTSRFFYEIADDLNISY